MDIIETSTCCSWRCLNHVHDHEYALILCAEFVHHGSTGNPKPVALLRSERERKYDQVVVEMQIDLCTLEK